MSTSERRLHSVSPSEDPRGASRESRWNTHLERISAGDARGLTALFDETSSLVYGVALRILRREADAEEVTSDVYIHIWNRSAAFDRSRGSITAWLMMLVRSRSIDRLRTRARAEQTDELGGAAHLSDGRETPEQMSWLRERRRRIQTALDSLPPDQRMAIEMAYFSGFTQSELAEHLRLPLGTIKTRIRLGMVKLREILAASDRGAL